MILRDHADALHVRLDGPPERRVAQAMEIEELGHDDAVRLRKDGDRAREAYVRHFYGCDARDPSLYHLVIDSTRLTPETVVEIIAVAARGALAGTLRTFSPVRAGPRALYAEEWADDRPGDRVEREVEPDERR